MIRLSLLSLLISYSLGAFATGSHNDLYTNAVKQDNYIRQAMRKHIGFNPLLEVIAACETTNTPDTIRHWESDGKLVKNQYSTAAGALQVLLGLHGEEIANLGYDMKNIDDYMRFVKFLLEAQGYDAWKSSKRCWGSSTHLAANYEGK